MKKFFLFFLLASSSFSQEKKSFQVEKLTVNGKELQKVVITPKNDSTASIRHENGIANIPWAELPQNIRDYFGYNKEFYKKVERAKVAELESKKENLVKLLKINSNGELLGKFTGREFSQFFKSYLKKLNDHLEVAPKENLYEILDDKWVFHPYDAILFILGRPHSFKETESPYKGNEYFMNNPLEEKATWDDVIINPATGKLEGLSFENRIVKDTSWGRTSYNRQYFLTTEGGTKFSVTQMIIESLEEEK